MSIVSPESIENLNIVSTSAEYYNIETDKSSYANSLSESNNVNTDDEMKEMTEEEKHDIKYLSIFENKFDDFDVKE